MKQGRNPQKCARNSTREHTGERISGCISDRAEGRTQDRAENTLSAALYLDLTATMLRSGLSIERALVRLAELNVPGHAIILRDVVHRLHTGATWQQAWGPIPEELPSALQELRDSLGVLVQAGAPSAELLTVIADRQSRHSFRASEQAAAELEVNLVLPLGLCSLPAFICLGVIPVLISLIPALGF